MTEENSSNGFSSSSEKLDTLAQKYFGSLIESSGQVYGSGELGTIPDMFPMLLMVVQEALQKIDPHQRTPEIEPGLTVTLDSMDKDKIVPSAFVSFTSKLRHGTFLVGSFSPIKYLNWAASRDLIKDISIEIDELFDDLQLVLDPIEWRDNKYEVITNIINERAQLVNRTLISRALHSSSQKEKNLHYQPEQIILAPIEMDYEKFPYIPVVLEENVNFWKNKEGDVIDFFRIINAVQSASMEPIKQLNRDSVSSADRKLLKQFSSTIKEYTSEYKESDITEIVKALKHDTPFDDQVQTLGLRYLGIRAIITMINQYSTILNEVLKKADLCENFIIFVKEYFLRRFSLGLSKPSSDQSIAKELLDSIVDLFRNFQPDLSSLDKADLNRAIIQCDSVETLDKLKQVSFTLNANDFERYIMYWSEEFSGLLPEEITLMLNTGVIYIVLDYHKMRILSVYSSETPKGPLDMGMIREYARKSIENDQLFPKMLIKD
ncbi:MAG: hypothetical protein ACXAC7_03595 [Candidatus Hodarchaeales archaeon]|jgi:hypothetical protein